MPAVNLQGGVSFNRRGSAVPDGLLTDMRLKRASRPLKGVVTRGFGLQTNHIFPLENERLEPENTTVEKDKH